VSVVPPGRWEWRTFGDSFGDAEEVFAGDPERVQESDELYLLSVHDADTVKVRDALMDVKHLERVSDEGLEQWRPVTKAGFPLAAADVVSVLASLRVEETPLARGEYTLDQLLDEVVRPCVELLPVSVHKLRRRYTIGGCMAELSDVSTAERATRTIAIEAEDPERVIAAVRELGLASRANTSFPRGLKALLHLGRFAVVDVGTNSVKFHIGERRANGSWRTVVDRSEITRLGEGLDRSGSLESEPMRRTVEAIAGMAEEAKQQGVAGIAAVGTAGMRMAGNSAELVEAVQARCGLTIEVIPGEEEARLAYRAATVGLEVANGTLAVFDTGGGSSQFTFGRGGRIDEQFSVNVGAVRFTEQFRLDDVVADDVLEQALTAVSADLEQLDGRPKPDVLVGIGGAVTNLAAVKHALASYDPEVVQGTVLDRVEIDRQIELYRTRSADGRREIPGLQPKRAEVILAGACVVHTVLRKLGRDSLTVSDRGLRHGLLVERFG
jgi:exopolyphosphatase / guanosine-5'-triphosphate,3'-diphosphate pyrophosphatase